MKMITLTPKAAKLISVLLEMAADKFGNHGCNDFTITDHVDMDADELRGLDKKMHEVNGDPEEHYPDGNHDHQADFALMGHFSEMLEEAIAALESNRER